MSYLTHEEFEELLKLDIDKEEFEKLLPKASAILDNITNHFYVKNDITKDNLWRVSKFKQALCAQVEYFNELGATTFESINSTPQTFTAGRTSITNASRYNRVGSNEIKPL